MDLLIFSKIQSYLDIKYKLMPISKIWLKTSLLNPAIKILKCGNIRTMWKWAFEECNFELITFLYLYAHKRNYKDILYMAVKMVGIYGSVLVLSHMINLMRQHSIDGMVATRYFITAKPLPKFYSFYTVDNFIEDPVYNSTIADAFLCGAVLTRNGKNISQFIKLCHENDYVTRYNHIIPLFLMGGNLSIKDIRQFIDQGDEWISSIEIYRKENHEKQWHQWDTYDTFGVLDTINTPYKSLLFYLCENRHEKIDYSPKYDISLYENLIYRIWNKDPMRDSFPRQNLFPIRIRKSMLIDSNIDIILIGGLLKKHYNVLHTFLACISSKAHRMVSPLVIYHAIKTREFYWINRLTRIVGYKEIYAHRKYYKEAAIQTYDLRVMGYVEKIIGNSVQKVKKAKRNEKRNIKRNKKYIDSDKKENRFLDRVSVKEDRREYLEKQHYRRVIKNAV